MIDDAIAELAPLVGKRAACRATGRPQANHYRRHRQSPAPPRPVRERRPQPRALSQAERDTVRALLNSPEFVDKAPATVYHELLDEGVYLASTSTMYRILRAHGEVRERGRQATHPARVKPELVATAPNQVYSWDITKLLGPTKWTSFYLYVIIDIYSRYVEAQFRTLKYRPDFPDRFGASRTPGRSANASSAGTTRSIGIPASPGTHPSQSTMDSPTRSGPPAPTS